MPVNVNTVQVGKCFRTKRNQVRYVEQVNGSEVVYRSRGGKATKDWRKTGTKTTVDRQKFADAVEGVVQADWDPSFGA